MKFSYAIKRMQLFEKSKIRSLARVLLGNLGVKTRLYVSLKAWVALRSLCKRQKALISTMQMEITYIDYIASWGPMILGHAYEPLVKAIQEKASGFYFIWCTNRIRN